MTGATRRDEVLGLLASFGGRQASQLPEGIDSLELAWLIHQVEQRYGRELDLDDVALARMATVSGAAELLDEVLDGLQDGSHDGAPNGSLDGAPAAPRFETADD